MEESVIANHIYKFILDAKLVPKYKVTCETDFGYLITTNDPEVFYWIISQSSSLWVNNANIRNVVWVVEVCPQLFTLLQIKYNV